MSDTLSTGDTLRRGSQQRDCPGLSPGSLLIAGDSANGRRLGRTIAGNKDISFFKIRKRKKRIFGNPKQNRMESIKGIYRIGHGHGPVHHFYRFWE